MKETSVLAFGVVADIVGKNSFTVSGVGTTTELKEKLETEFPALKNISYAIAVNKQLVTVTTPLEVNTTVALLPPFSGG